MGERRSIRWSFTPKTTVGIFFVCFFGDAKGLLLDGLLDKGGSIAEHAIVVDAHLGQGNVLLFGNNPVYRGETVGTYPMVFNAILNYQHLERHKAEPAAATTEKKEAE